MASRKRSSAWFRVGLVGIGLLGLILVAQAFKHSIDRQSPRNGTISGSGGAIPEVGKPTMSCAPTNPAGIGP